MLTVETVESLMKLFEYRQMLVTIEWKESKWVEDEGRIWETFTRKGPLNKRLTEFVASHNEFWDGKERPLAPIQITSMVREDYIPGSDW